MRNWICQRDLDQAVYDVRVRRYIMRLRIAVSVLCVSCAWWLREFSGGGRCLETTPDNLRKQKPESPFQRAASLCVIFLSTDYPALAHSPATHRPTAEMSANDYYSGKPQPQQGYYPPQGMLTHARRSVGAAGILLGDRLRCPAGWKYTGGAWRAVYCIPSACLSSFVE